MTQHPRTLDQGVPTVTDPETGRIYPIPAGGSGNAAPPTNSTVDQAVAAMATAAGEGEGAAGADGEDVQPSDDSGTGTADTGQGLLDQYLDGLDGDQRTLVAERLERFRSDADSNANRKIQELSEQLSGFKKFTDDPAQLEPIVDFYAWLMQEPEAALPWAVEALHTERGVPLETMRDPLLAKLGIDQPPSGAGDTGQQAPAGGQPTGEGASPDKPLTREDLEQWTQEQKAAEQRERDEAQRREQAAKQLNSWVDDSLKKFDLEERIPSESPMRQFIYQHALQLMQSGGIRNGQVAIETATEQVKAFLDGEGGSSSDPKNPGSQPKAPRTANGGGPVTKPDSYDPTDKKSRVDLAASLLAAATSEE